MITRPFHPRCVQVPYGLCHEPREQREEHDGAPGVDSHALDAGGPHRGRPGRDDLGGDAIVGHLAAERAEGLVQDRGQHAVNRPQLAEPFEQCAVVPDAEQLLGHGRQAVKEVPLQPREQPWPVLLPRPAQPEGRPVRVQPLRVRDRTRVLARKRNKNALFQHRKGRLKVDLLRDRGQQRRRRRHSRFWKAQAQRKKSSKRKNERKIFFFFFSKNKKQNKKKTKTKKIKNKKKKGKKKKKKKKSTPFRK